MTCLYLQREAKSTSSDSRTPPGPHLNLELSNESSTPLSEHEDEPNFRGNSFLLAADLFDPFRGLPKMPSCKNGDVVPDFLLVHRYIKHIHADLIAISNKAQRETVIPSLAIRNECVRNSVNALA